MTSTLGALDFGDMYNAGWPAAMRAISRINSVPDRTQWVFLRLYLRSGDHIRQETTDDLTLIRALRVLLPAYTGPAVRLYRGQNAQGPRMRCYGLSWTRSREVAESHAKGLWRACSGGSMVLETLAPTDAVICRVDRNEDRYGETEYLLDRRRLHRVKVLTRYAQQLQELSNSA
jgi:hypothetical protein